jgi:hypothetical protein
MPLPLKFGARPEQALQILEMLGVELRNLPARGAGGGSFSEILRRRQNSYLEWIELAEGQLGNFTDQPHVSAQLHTRAYWAIREADARTPRAIPLIDAEIRAQKEAIERIAKDMRQREERLKSTSGHIAVLDTHTLLHYQPPEQVDWPAVVGTEPIRLLLPMRVVDELDEKKYTGSERVRRKARAAQRGVRAVPMPDSYLRDPD